MKPGKKNVFFVIVILVFLAAFFAFSAKKPASKQEKANIADNQAESSLKGEIAETEQPEPAPEENTEKPAEDPKPQIPEKFSLDTPFYSQAPLSKWDAFHEDMCEEASVLNAALYLEEKKLTKEQFEAELQKMQNAEKKEIGEWKSTTVTQIKKVSDIYFDGKIKSKIIDNPTIEDIEAEIAAGHPVVVPLAGRDIGNPNFTPPGPVYHMLTIKGYDTQNFITNDVGTRKGNSYPYKKGVIMKNMHDWNEKDIHLGEKRLLVLYK
ncbi:MAG: C39 family peptidase [Candidatus Moranbacteria bacterium]|nr:C39 family peptidase [Candidatus Moranbacteria bacterium]